MLSSQLCKVAYQGSRSKGPRLSQQQLLPTNLLKDSPGRGVNEADIITGSAETPTPDQ